MKINTKFSRLSLAVAISFFVFCSMIYTQNIKENRTVVNLRSAVDTINVTDININDTIVYRGIETLNITYDNSLFNPTTEDFISTITFSDASQYNTSTMVLSGTANRFYALFTPSITNKTGATTVSIFAISKSNGAKLNTGESTKAFTIENNLPSLGVTFNATQIQRGNYVSMNLMPSDMENSISNLNWELRVVKSAGDEVLIVKGAKSLSYTYFIGLTAATGSLTINATCWDADSSSKSILYTITVLDNGPQFTNIKILRDTEDVSAYSSIDMYRYNLGLNTPVLTFKINATDVDDLSNLKITMTALDPVMDTNVLFPITNYLNFTAETNTPGYFVKNITFPITMNVGLVNLNIRLYDGSGLFVEQTKVINVLNNAPVLSSVKLNGKINEQLSLVEGDMLNFTFEASDVEGQISYLKVALLYSKDATSSTLLWQNYTVQYHGVNTIVLLRASDLPAGVFTAYAYVIDKDGAQTGYQSAIQFTISESSQFNATTWLLFVVGIILGLSVGLAVMFWRSQRIKTTTKTDSEDKSKSKEKAKSKEVKENKDQKKDTKPEVKKETKSDTKKETKEPAKSEEKTSEKENKEPVSNKPSKKFIRKM